MKEIIQLRNKKIGGAIINAVDARELHLFLDSKQEFSNWFKNRIDQYDFQENQDFIINDNFINNSSRRGPKPVEYIISLDMAKELSMVERNERGKQARKYFIEVEKKFKAHRIIQTQEYTPIGKVLKDQVRHFKSGVQLAKTSGLSRNQALLKANRLTLVETGRDCLKSIGMECLPIPGNEADHVPSDLGRKLGGLSGRAVNALLEKAGLQEKFRAHSGKIQWEPTERGKAYATIKETSRQYATGTCRQIFWKESVLDVLEC